jgi:hypothetical protein
MGISIGTPPVNTRRCASWRQCPRPSFRRAMLEQVLPVLLAELERKLPDEVK